MHTIILPKIEPNMEEAMIVLWKKKEGEYVLKREILFEIETAKALIEIEAEQEGILRKIIVPQGKIVPILTPVGLIGTENEPILEIPVKSPHLKEENEIKKEQYKENRVLKNQENEIKASPSARKLAREKDIDLSLIKGTGPDKRIIEEDILLFLESKKKHNSNSLKKERVLIIGAGNGGEVVAGILDYNEQYEIIGFLDDNQTLWGKMLAGKLILGGISLIEQLLLDNKFEKVITSITSNMKIRKKIYDLLTEKQCIFINAIHHKAYIHPSAQVGQGNIIGAFVHIGYGAVVGDNNLITAHCDIEHHNCVGSHTLFGPGVMTSGDVQIGNNCSLGAGVNIEPHIIIGNNVAIASGSTIIYNIPSDTIIKREFKNI